MISSLYVSLIFVRQVFGERQALVGLSSTGNFNFRNPWCLLDGFLSLAGGHPEGRFNTNLGFEFKSSGKKAMDGNLVFSNSHITPYFLFREAKPLTKWFVVDRTPLKQEEVFAIWKRFHIASNTWWGARIINRPCHTLKFGTLEPCDISLIRWISRCGSTIRNDCAVWWGRGDNHCAPSRGDILLRRWIEKVEWTVMIKEAYLVSDCVCNVRILKSLANLST